MRAPKPARRQNIEILRPRVTFQVRAHSTSSSLRGVTREMHCPCIARAVAALIERRSSRRGFLYIVVCTSSRLRGEMPSPRPHHWRDARSRVLAWQLDSRLKNMFAAQKARGALRPSRVEFFRLLAARLASLYRMSMSVVLTCTELALRREGARSNRPKNAKTYNALSEVT